MLSKAVCRLVTWEMGMLPVVSSFVLSKSSVWVMVYLAARLLATALPKLASSLIAAANSFRVSRTAGAPSIRLLTLFATSVLQKLVVAAVLSLLS